jgi:NAD(P)-dependent dehydrogenase (short-subunit alcohol dehydrogenase family)
MNAFEINRKTVFVTGVASGLGFEICMAFAKAGANILAADVNQNALNALTKAARGYGCDVVTFCLDVNDPQAFSELALRLKNTERLPHIVVNNAGIDYLGRLLEHDLATWKRYYDVILVGVVNGCHAFLPLLKTAGDRRYLINVASLVSSAPVPNMGVYAASKYAVHGLNQMLAMELVGSNIEVLSVFPSIISNNAIPSSGSDVSAISDQQLAKLQEHYRIESRDPSLVANDIVASVIRHEKQLFPGVVARSNDFLKRLCTARLFRRLRLDNARSMV